MAEVVSDEEYRLALKCGFLDKDIIFNGTIKGKDLFDRACDSGAYINLDSNSDLKYLSKFYRKESLIGIRVNIPTEIFNKEDIFYTEDGFRFGYSDYNDELYNVLKQIYSLNNKTKIGLHVHCNSVTRNINVCERICDYIIYLIKKYSLKLKYIDMGGGFLVV